MLTSNQRGSWRASVREIREWRQAAGWSAIACKLKPQRRLYLLAELRFANRRKRDVANWYPTIKACIDGLVDVGVLADDDERHLVGPDLRLGALDVMPRVFLHLWRIGDV